jgi:hypothetical protein
MLPGVVSSRSPRARSRSRTPAPAASLRRAPASRCRAAGTFFSLITCCWYYRGDSRGDFTWDRHDFHPGVPPRRPPGVENGHRAARRTRTTGADGDGDGHRVSRPRVRGPVVDGEPTGPAVLDRGKKSASTRKQRRDSLDPPAGPGRPSPGKIKHSLAAFNPDRPHAAHLAAAGPRIIF